MQPAKPQPAKPQPAKQITITDQETQYLTQNQRHAFTFSRILENFDINQPVQYDYNPHTQTTTLTQ